MTCPLPGQPPSAPDEGQRVDLVMEGGGVKGIALAGALEVLEERGYRVNRVAGSSAGSIAGALATAGIPAATIVQILRETDYRRFADGPWWTRPLPGKGLSLLLHLGVHRGTVLTDWLEEQLARHGAPGRTGTFADLRYRDPTADASLPAQSADPLEYRLVVTVSDLTSGRLRFLPLDADAFGTAPEQLRVADAVRASTSLPLFFRPVRWRNARGRPTWLIDGGLLSNFPVSVFDRPDGLEPRWPTFGIKLSARPETDPGVENEISGPLSFGRALVDTVTGFHDRMHIESTDAAARTIFVDTEAVSSTRFDLSGAEQDLLHAAGREAAEGFLDGDDEHEPWDFARYVDRFRSERRR